jgi:hypothetical protein
MVGGIGGGNVIGREALLEDEQLRKRFRTVTNGGSALRGTNQDALRDKAELVKHFLTSLKDL